MINRKGGEGNRKGDNEERKYECKLEGGKGGIGKMNRKKGRGNREGE